MCNPFCQLVYIISHETIINSERKSSTITKQAITVSKSEFWYGTPIKDDSSIIMEPKHSITDGNIHKKARPKSAIITTIPTSNTNELSNKYATNKIDGYKRPVVEYGLVKQRAKVSLLYTI